MDATKFVIQEEEALHGTRIKVIGVGGGGSNAVARMMNEGLTGVEFHILNTDVQALNASPVPNKLAICSKARTWCLSQPDSAVTLEPARRPWWLPWPKS